MIFIADSKDQHPIDAFFNHFKLQNRTWLDRATFPRIFLTWFVIVCFMGLSYFFFTGGDNYLIYTINSERVSTLQDSLYFSFITATTTGFGDIIPHGMFKLLSIFEAVFGFLLLALVTSKLVSLKQDTLLSELYELSFNERINRLHTSLLQFRQNVDRIITKVEEGTFKKRETHAVHIFASSLESSLQNTLALIQTSGKHEFIHSLNEVTTEQIMTNIISCFEKIHELVHAMDQKKRQWKLPEHLAILGKTLSLNEDIFNALRTSGVISPKLLEELSEQNDAIIKKILEDMGPRKKRH